MDVVGYVKGHPYTIGALVIGGIVVFVLIRRASGGTTVVAGSSGPSDAQLASSTNLALAQISAGVADNQTNGELAAAKIQADLGGQVAGYQYQLGVLQTDAGKDVSLATITANLQALLSNNDTALSISKDNNATTLGGMNIQAGVASQQITANSNIEQALIAALTPKAQPVTQVPTVSQVLNPADVYIAQNPDVAAAYPVYLQDQATWETGGFSAGDTEEQFAAQHYTIAGKNEGRPWPAIGGNTAIPTAGTSQAA